MSRTVATMLAEGGRAEYDRVLAFKYILLADVLAEARPDDERLRAALQQLTMLDGLNAAELSRLATPFFWFNVHRLYARRLEPDADLAELAEYLAVAAFDSFFEQLPENAEVRVSGGRCTLPRLGISFASDGPLVLRRRGMEVDSGGVAAEPTGAIAVHDEPRSLVLPRADRSILGDAEIAKLSHSPETFSGLAGMIRSSLDMIAAADPRRGAALNSLIRWYFPISTPDRRTTHNSFSAVHLVGTIFLSEAYEDIRLVEAIVHEFHHNELHLLMEARLLFEPEPGRLYYSPWRDDPRPLHGLFHALHVFSGVVDFYQHALATASLRAHHDTFRERSVQICWQLRTGLSQVSSAPLTAAGRQIIDSIHAELRELESALGGLPETMPPTQQRHLDNWRAQNPALMDSVLVPA
jgi:HEXXH motif-containing protein